MIQWLIKIGTPGWTGGRQLSSHPYLHLMDAILGLGVLVFCAVGAWNAVSAGDYARACFYMLLAQFFKPTGAAP